MRQSNGCSTPALRSSEAKQWFEELTQNMKKTDSKCSCLPNNAAAAKGNVSMCIDSFFYYNDFILTCKVPYQNWLCCHIVFIR